MRLLIERTIDTGQERLAPLSEADPDILARLRPLLREAIKSGQRVHVDAGWWCQITSEEGDQPWVPLRYQLFPAGAGMNRRPRRIGRAGLLFPRRRGGALLTTITIITTLLVLERESDCVRGQLGMGQLAHWVRSSTPGGCAQPKISDSQHGKPSTSLEGPGLSDSGLKRG